MTCTHDPQTWRRVGFSVMYGVMQRCACGAEVLNDEQISQLMQLRDQWPGLLKPGFKGVAEQLDYLEKLMLAMAEVRG